MTLKTNAGLVGNSFKLGYRFQRYWDNSMAYAFFFAEAGAGLFLVSYFFNFLPGMIAGLAVAGTLKPYFHITHMGVPDKSWRAIIRPDRSWISRGAIAIGVMVGFGVLHVLDVAYGLGLPATLSSLIGWLAVLGTLTVMCYQGMAMSASESLTLWASALLPVSSFCYSLTAGVMLALAGGWEFFDEAQRHTLAQASLVLLILDALVVIGIVMRASAKSKGGAFSVEMLLRGEYSRYFLGLVFAVGLALPLVIMAVTASQAATIVAVLAMLVGFMTLRLLLLKAAVFEPITHDLAGSIGLPVAH